MPKYYNTAYEIWLFIWVGNNNNFERAILYDDLYIILENFQNKYPNIINIENLSKTNFKNPNNHIERWELSKIIIEIFKLNQDLNSVDMSRGEFIKMIVSYYLKINNKELSVNNLNFDINDLDYNSDYAPYIMYAKEQGILDYLVEIKRGEIYLKPDSLISKHEVYYVITKALWISLDLGLSSSNNDNITKWELAKILSDIYGFQGNITTQNSQPNSKLEQLFDKIAFFTKNKTLTNLIL